MNKLFAVLIIGLLGLWPIVAHAGEPGRAGEQAPEQRRLLNKDEIRVVQKRLMAEGFYPGPIDGELNAQTEEAIRQYQQKQGIPVSGALDEATLRELQLPATPPGGTGSR
jgi:peptidoglycan hydrolase-like protein with peptidoglycan-binding domain